MENKIKGNLIELSKHDLRSLKGGFIPLVWGGAVILKASTVKALALSGIAVGAAGGAAALND